MDRRRFLKQSGGALAALTALSGADSSAARSDDGLPVEGQPKVGAELRRAYSLCPAIRYLNHASIGTMPRRVREALQRYQEVCESNPWLYIWGGGWEEAREWVRARAASSLGVASQRVALTHNTTEAFNLLARGLPLGRGDEVLFSSLNHPGASLCWERYGAERGYGVRRFDFPLAEVPQITEDRLLAIYGDQIGPRTRVLVFPHVDNLVGLRHPVAALARLARSRGVRTVAVDGAQAVGMIPVADAADAADAYATSPHKWVQAPKGTGLLAVSEALLSELTPLMVTWGQERWKGSARIFEDYGTRDLPSLLALGDALDFQNAFDPQAREDHYRSLAQVARRRVEGSSGLRWLSPRAWDLGASLFTVRATEGTEAARRLREAGFVFRPFAGPELEGLRVSPNLANEGREIHAFFDVLEEAAGSGA